MVGTCFGRGIITGCGLAMFVALISPGSLAQYATAGDMEIIPWVEFNYPSDPADPDAEDLIEIVDGLEIWATMTDKVMVTTRAGCAVLYQTLNTVLADRGVNIMVIPGIKTSSIYSDGCHFDELSFWESVADEVLDICTYAESDVCVLENEHASCCYYRDGNCGPEGWCNCDYGVDLEQLESSLCELPANIQYWWWPSVPGFNPEIQDRAADLCQAAVNVLGDRVHFFAHLLCAPHLLNDQLLLDAHEKLMDITGNQPTLPIMWFYNVGDYWHDNQINGALCHAITCHEFEQVCIYPGYYNWYDNTAAIVSYYGAGEVCCPDINCNGVLDYNDLIILLTAYDTCAEDPDYEARADFDASGCVDLMDLTLLLSEYPGECWPSAVDSR